jgi:hypothetical protein
VTSGRAEAVDRGAREGADVGVGVAVELAVDVDVGVADAVAAAGSSTRYVHESVAV